MNVFHAFEGPPTFAMVLIQNEIDGVLESISRYTNMFLYSPRPPRWTAPLSTLLRRFDYGGKKGRAARRRLRRRIEWTASHPMVTRRWRL